MLFAWAMSFHELGFSTGRSLRLAAGGTTAGFTTAGTAVATGFTTAGAAAGVGSAAVPSADVAVGLAATLFSIFPTVSTPGFFAAAHARARALVSALMLGLEPDLTFGLRSNAIG